MLSTVLLFVSVLFRNQIVTIIADIALIVIEFVLKSTVDWRVADKVVPSLIIGQMIHKTNDKLVILSFTLMIVVFQFHFTYLHCLFIVIGTTNNRIYSFYP